MNDEGAGLNVIEMVIIILAMFVFAWYIAGCTSVTKPGPDSVAAVETQTNEEHLRWVLEDIKEHKRQKSLKGSWSKDAGK